MMNGYSITEAASVLGVPTERVWELLARGVLAGEPEGETGMRVFLQPRPAPAPVTAIPADDPSAGRSNGPERELSPFRELLTEFRSLTERYGQALLALGEARGEVASLRSRVDLLEARIDLRLPMGGPSTAPWPPQPLPISEPAAPAEPAIEHEDEETHRRRRRGARRATEGFAQALARAEDPSLADRPRSTDADALAAFRSEADAAEAERVLPREVIPAEPMLVADEAAVAEVAEAPPEPGIEGEAPELIGDGDEAVGEPVVAGLEVAPEPEPVSAEPEPAEVEPEPVSAEPEPVETEAIEPAPEPIEVEPEPVDVASVLPEEPVAEPDRLEEEVTAGPPAPAPEAWPEPEAMDEGSEGEPAQVGEAAPEVVAPEEDVASEEEPEPRAAATAEQVLAEPEPQAEAEPADFDAERYTTVIEQPDWFEAEADESWATATPGDETIADIEESAAPADAAPADEPDAIEMEASDEVAAEASATERDDGGADEMEVAGGAQGPSVQTEESPHEDASVQTEESPQEDASAQPEEAAHEDPSVQREEAPAQGGLPGSRELDEALEAFGDVGRRPAPPAEGEEEWPPSPGGPDRIAPSAQATSAYGAATQRQPYTSPLSSGPATRAYRRLRRIFPT